MQPFVDVRVIPAYGSLSARVIWKVTEGVLGRFSVWKSIDGINGWKEIGTVVNDNNFTDTEVKPSGKRSETFYRVVLQANGRRYDSPVVSTFGHLTKQEFGATRTILNLEFRDLRRRTKILIYKLRLEGSPCPLCVDDTGQKIGVSLCQTCYGTGMKDGYWPPIDSFMKVLTLSPVVQADNSGGAGSDDPTYITARMLAFPSLIKNDLILDPATDRRYLVETSDIAMFNGKAPLVSTVSLLLLRRTDVRYKLPVP